MAERDILISQYALLEQLLSQWLEAEKEGYSLSIFLVDVDDFTQLENKSACFDKVLETVRGLFHRETDFITRFNRKQILVLTSHISFKQSTQLAKRIHEAVAKLEIFHPYSPNGRYLTVSIGHTTYSPEPEDSYGVLDILTSAFRHMRDAKKAGGNCSKTQLRSRLLK